LPTAGDHYQITDLAGFPVPVQQPHPPLLVGVGSRRMLGLARREADIVGICRKAAPERRRSVAVARGWGTGAATQVLDMPSAFIGPVQRIVDLMEERRNRNRLLVQHRV
jgi:hypothetical protein